MKILTLLSLLFLAIPCMAQDNQAAEDAGESIARIAEHMPLMLASDCPTDAPYPSRKSCSDRAMLEYIYGNLEFPAAASSLTGPAKMAVVNFVVEADGSISNVEVYRDPGNGMGAEAVRLVEQMAQETKWKPAMQEGEPIRLLMQMPIKFSKPE
ncbi:energy transducer TonB [Neolewinella sp.]|uniref:energy transducer TonB n=1 Tax=Neolewinella sp. TaxID=2993543 RepID=UPI003B52E922